MRLDTPGENTSRMYSWKRLLFFSCRHCVKTSRLPNDYRLHPPVCDYNLNQTHLIGEGMRVSSVDLWVGLNVLWVEFRLAAYSIPLDSVNCISSHRWRNQENSIYARNLITVGCSQCRKVVAWTVNLRWNGPSLTPTHSHRLGKNPALSQNRL